MPTPASALPVLIASSNWSVLPPKLISSTSRLWRLKMPVWSATGTPTVQMALAFQVSRSFVSGLASMASGHLADRRGAQRCGNRQARMGEYPSGAGGQRRQTRGPSGA